jgi:molybdopterin-containing oxidoreductase family iron-sulfur binding subunit
MTALVEDLQGHPGQSVVLAGGHQPAAVHASICLLNESLGAYGRTLQWNPRPARIEVTEPSEVSSLLAGGADVLICLGVNPVYDWPGGHFEDLIKQVGLSVGHGLYRDETLSVCEIALPSSHNLESWNDAMAHAGVESLCQPVIRPLYESRQEAESLLKWTQALAPEDDPLHELEDWHDFVQTQWGRRHYPETADAQDRWEASLRTGIALNPITIERPSLDASLARRMATAALPGGGAYELVILPDAGVYDGRFANSTWLQELPDPVTRLVWDNAAMISPATAQQLKVQEGNVNAGDVHVDQIYVETSGSSIVLPILILPGVADGVIVTTTGYGRSAGGSVSRGRGANAARLMEATVTPWVSYSVTAKKAAGRVKLARTQKHFKMRGDREKHDRPLALEGNLTDYLRNPSFLKHQHPEPKAVELYKAHHSNDVGYRWAMVIDLSRCVGCHACVTACQAENNIPAVGKTECANGREMHWMRIDLYHTGDSDNPTVHHQPMLCQQCENAPCENVCPVAATSHGPEGLNEMVYNRCVGTRYCANNCPYKVRRYNFFDYQKQTQPEVIQAIHSPVEQLAYNPQVTVRSRGVMEKCTFCVQRINAAKFEARNAGRKVADGEIQTACQQACPAKAIIFGNINDPDSLVARERASPLTYFVLEQLNVKPSIGYKARMRNRVDIDQG